MGCQEVVDVWGKKIISSLRLVIKFWIFQVKYYEEAMVNEQNQNGRGGIKSIRWHMQKAEVLQLPTFVHKGGSGKNEKFGHKISMY